MADNGYFHIPRSIDLNVHRVGEVIEERVKSLLRESDFLVIESERIVQEHIDALMNAGYEYDDAVQMAINSFKNVFPLPFYPVKKRRIPDILIGMPIDDYRTLYPVEITGSLKYYLRDYVEGGRRSGTVYIEAGKRFYYANYPYTTYLLSYYADNTFNIMSSTELYLFHGVVLRTFYVELDDIYETEFSYQVPTNVFKPMEFLPIEKAYNIIVRQRMVDNYTASEIHQIYLFKGDSLAGIVNLDSPVTIDADVESYITNHGNTVLSVYSVIDEILNSIEPDVEIEIHGQSGRRLAREAAGYARELTDRLRVIGFAEPYKREFYYTENGNVLTVIVMRKWDKVIVKATKCIDERTVDWSVTAIYDPRALVDDYITLLDKLTPNVTYVTSNFDTVYDILEEVLMNL